MDNPRPHIPAQMIGAKKMSEAGPLQAVGNILLQRVMNLDEGGYQSNPNDENDDDDARKSQSAFPKILKSVPETFRKSVPVKFGRFGYHSYDWNIFTGHLAAFREHRETLMPLT
jgi:hypothetical protein